jgi:hypothetical protein
VGNAVVDVINGNGLGSAAAGDTTPPETYLDSGPADGSTVFSGTVTFVFHSSEDPFATFTCILISHPDAGDASTTIENNCGQPSDTQPVTYSKTYPSLANGQYSFYVQATDAANNTDPTPATTSFGVGVDNTAPTASIGTPKTAGAPVIVTFSEPVKSIGAADVSVTPSANVALSCLNGAAAADCVAGPVTTLAIKPGRAFTPGQSYNVELDPAGAIAPITDTAGNPLADTNATFRSSLKEEETSAAATFSWRKVSATSASGGSYAEDNRAGATASYTFTGTSVSWSTITGPNQGKATVLVDGAKKLAVNNYAKTTRYGVVRSVSGLSNAAHTITVVVSGTKGAAGATDTQVAIDSFVAGATTVQNTAPAVRYTWQNVKASKASGHRYAAAATRGDSVSFVFAGTGVTWQTVTSRAMGKATVSIDGKKNATVDNYSSATKYGVKRHYGGLSAGVHTLTIKVLGHRRSASTANTVAVDRWTVT